ncbi:MAG TPA: DUF2161 family putative PD-(D/E)XK-type phosphodiesterase [Myxococcota bacterium]|nr:DUF2161 family putative PD-(D/E)XK-type phosphodiesterase [Myxococcota bacterium]
MGVSSAKTLVSRTLERETDLYGPVRAFLERQGYTVRSEVLGCDVAGRRGDDLVMVELKRALTTDLLVQATRRQRTTNSVYVAVPRPRAGHGSRWQGLLHLLRRLELGLLIVSFSGRRARVQAVLHPLPFDRRRSARGRRAILEEMAGRSGDHNQGGSVRSPLVTAYRENAIYIACGLERNGPLAPRALRALGTGPKTLSILRSNVYGWFERVGYGVYALSAQGRSDLSRWPDLVADYRSRIAREIEKEPAPTATGSATPASARGCAR